jgi:immune inhibitor A
VGVTDIPATSASMPVHLTVKFQVKPKDAKDLKDQPKESKELKERIKEEQKEIKEAFKEFPEGSPFDRFAASRGSNPGAGGDLEARLSAIEQTLQSLLWAVRGGSSAGVGWPSAGEPFIGESERPQLGMDLTQPDLSDLRAQMESGSAEAKRMYDNLPPR